MTEQLARIVTENGIRDERVREAVARLPRRAFLPWPLRPLSDLDLPLPIGLRQTTSQPSLLAFVAEQLELAGGERVLEVGTGTGYQAALLGLLAREVHTVEIATRLARRAAAVLRRLGLANVHVHAGDGALGWPAAVPFDRIVLAAAVRELPPALLDQLAPGGRLVAPVGRAWQEQTLMLFVKALDGAVTARDLLPVAYVRLRRPRHG